MSMAGPAPRPGARCPGHENRTGQQLAARPRSRGTRSRILKARQELSVMAHDEIQALANDTAAPMTLKHKLSTLEQQRRLRGVFLGCKLVQPQGMETPRGWLAAGRSSSDWRGGRHC